MFDRWVQECPLHGANKLQANLANSLVAALLEFDLSPAYAVELFDEKPRDSWHASVARTRNIRHLKGAAVIPLPAGGAC